MYTPLAEYKLHQLFAQPTLILTHYTDLANSHGLVLMRGNIMPSVAPPKSPPPKLTS
jgi:ATP synthase F1 complex assembly factor 1